jgi:N-acetyl-1-D-myo-inositol-2-amino-2-deoxy-alpha-D-glucopyranoside deacetylase
MSTFLILHAHPDDEAIFTGGTIALLAERGHRVVVVFATGGELGAGDVRGLGDVRRREAIAACDALGVARVVFMDHHDSGLEADHRLRPWGAFADEPVEVVAQHVADIAVAERATAIVSYDTDGVYGHADHVQASRVAEAARQLAGVPTSYEVTVDREYLHFVDTHVAHMAGDAIPDRVAIGRSTVEIDLTVDVRPALDRKIAAIAAHASQIDDPTFGAADRFPAVYGFEWYIRHGAATAIDELSIATARAADVLTPFARTPDF